MSKKITALLLFFTLLITATGATYDNETYIISGIKETNTLTSSKDKHWYKFETTVDNGDIYIYLSNTTAPVRFNVYDSNKKQIVWGNSSYFNSLTKGTYYIEVYPSSWGNSHSSGSYDLLATYSDGNSSHNPATHEPNDTRENAFTLTSGKNITSSLPSSFDRDFYKITTTADNGDVYIYLSNTTAPVRFNV
ncbi:hypothetical protein ACJ2A9_23270 [Anaerobacillus sp. MEB173]|uniref:hypothetical protein n=1 Tax=Anaerobacillus sp. MEB173 TaxID=3383345 RepID=UPI003F9073C6